MSEPEIIDAVGLLCPLPVLKLRKRMKPLAAGDVIVLRADDPAAVIDVPHFCAEAGHELIETVEDGTATLYRVRKG
ncbi:Sulfurtransferase TusA [Roseovarius sp. THAF8]|uniref:sulfurtransferase TusA family protein n=1 Tax=Roseovarius sp. THAF8 TaxID=2587846 RepID=UPI001268B05B|nr:sulfurtransferase TusA family protein [Roseovarius sp. THAF8]QFT96097.1 Sulfurtransferase TusA [Roseovarius sp. THAF8]